MAEDTPALLDRVIDSSHRSFLAVVQRVKLNVLRPRPPAELIPVDPRWVPRWYVVGLCFWEYVCFVYVSYIMYLPLIVLLFRLSEAGLLTIGRLAESGLAKLDRSLLTALVDRWRPETHTFHLPCGEMAPTLQDVAMLLGFCNIPKIHQNKSLESFQNLYLTELLFRNPSRRSAARHRNQSQSLLFLFLVPRVA